MVHDLPVSFLTTERSIRSERKVNVYKLNFRLLVDLYTSRCEISYLTLGIVSFTLRGVFENSVLVL